MPMYIIGAVAWIVIGYGTLSGAAAPWLWPLRDILVSAILCGVLFPLAIMLMCVLAPAYFPKRVAAILLLPIPAMIEGIFLSSDNLAPFHMIGSALASLALVIFLLQHWAHRT